MLARTPKDAIRAWEAGEEFIIFVGDCRKLMNVLPKECIDLAITSPPYFTGKNYDKSRKVDDFISEQNEIAKRISPHISFGGNICWQVGYHSKFGEIFPLDYAVYSAFTDCEDIFLRNRIIWLFGHGPHGRKRFSGRHETILWFSKGKDYFFDLDAVRVAQKYPGKRHYKGSKKGQFSGNPDGKNPSDVWEIPNIKAAHVEKTDHPCQFPITLAQRLVRALCRSEGTVLDPFAGVASAGLAARIEGRRFLGAEISEKFAEIAMDRYTDFKRNSLRYRPDVPVRSPTPGEAVSQKPIHFRI